LVLNKVSRGDEYTSLKDYQDSLVYFVNEVNKKYKYKEMFSDSDK
jgi:hypothetical protein